jgi:hypothetical protein
MNCAYCGLWVAIENHLPASKYSLQEGDTFWDICRFSWFVFWGLFSETSK